LYGLNALAGLVPAALRRLGLDSLLLGLVTAYVAAFPLLPNPASLHLPSDLGPTGDQLVLRAAVDWMKNNGLGTSRPSQPLYASHPSICDLAGRDPFDAQTYKKLYFIREGVPKGAILVWDNWFSVLEHGVAPDSWATYTADYALRWQGDTTVNGAYSEVRIFERR
jgi:hypothetical protein